MKKISFLLIVLSISLLTFAQSNGDLENQFYLRFGLSKPTKSYFGIDEKSMWDNTKRIGGIFELGSIYMLNSLPLSDGLRLGINVDYAEFSYHQFDVMNDGLIIRILKLSSKVGPSISYSPVSELVFDAYIKIKIPWIAGAGIYYDDPDEDTQYYRGELGIGFSTGFNVRYRFLMVGFEFNKDKMELINEDDSEDYIGNFKDNDKKTPMPSFNITFGFSF